MNILIDKLPDVVIVNGVGYPIETDFREWIRFTKLVEDAAVPWQMKCRLFMQWYTDGTPADLVSAINALGDFLAMKLEETEREDAPARVPKPVYDFDEDMTWIYSAFREVYGINLQSIAYMHWWEFQTLFIGLPENTEIKQRIMYRNMDLSSIKDKNERKRVRKIQKAIELKKKRRKMTDYEIGDMFA